MVWVEGQSGNPAGGQSAGAKLNRRLDQWLHNKTVGEIKRIIDTPEEWDNLPSIDGLLARRLSNGLAESKDNTKDFTAILEFYAGKPKQALTGGDEEDKPLFPSKVEVELVRTIIKDTNSGSV